MTNLLPTFLMNVARQGLSRRSPCVSVVWRKVRSYCQFLRSQICTWPTWDRSSVGKTIIASLSPQTAIASTAIADNLFTQSARAAVFERPQFVQKLQPRIDTRLRIREQVCYHAAVVLSCSEKGSDMGSDKAAGTKTVDEVFCCLRFATERSGSTVRGFVVWSTGVVAACASWRLLSSTPRGRRLVEER